jgi:hypothetical protein
MFNPQQSQQQQQTQLTLTPEMARMLLTYGNNGVGTSYGVNPMMAMGRTFAKGGSVQTSPRLIQGPGDGMSDGIATSINGVEPAALSDSEHVTPALQVSLLGRGSPQAGSERIQALIDKEIKRMYGEGIDAVDMQDKAMRKQ